MSITVSICTASDKFMVIISNEITVHKIKTLKYIFSYKFTVELTTTFMSCSLKFVGIGHTIVSTEPIVGEVNCTACLGAEHIYTLGVVIRA